MTNAAADAAPTSQSDGSSWRDMMLRIKANEREDTSLMRAVDAGLMRMNSMSDMKDKAKDMKDKDMGMSIGGEAASASTRRPTSWPAGVLNHTGPQDVIDLDNNNWPSVMLNNTDPDSTHLVDTFPCLHSDSLLHSD